MSPNDFREALLERMLSLVWRQWTALGMATHSSPHTGSPADIEALLMASTVLASHDHRLDKFIEEARRNLGTLLHYSRLGRMEKALNQLAYGCGVRSTVPSTGRSAGTAKEAAWFSKSVLALAPPGLPTVQLALRHLFGVNSRADIMLFLLSGSSGSSAAIARAVWTDQKTAYRILEGWIKAGICQRPAIGRKRGYLLTRGGQWGQLLNLPSPVPRVDWAYNLMPFLVLLEGVSQSPRAGDRYLLASLMRDLSDRLADIGTIWRIHFPDHRAHLGPAFFEPGTNSLLTILDAMNQSG